MPERNRSHLHGRSVRIAPAALAHRGDTVRPMWIWIALVFLVGFAVAFQGPINQNLGVRLGHPMWAALVSFGIGTVTVALVTLTQRPEIPGKEQFTGLPWWSLIGGVLGACFVVTAIFAIPHIGATGFLLALVVGQATASLLVDHNGWFGLQRIPITPTRALGVMIMLVGFYLARHAPADAG